MSKKKKKRKEHRGRWQAQGGGLEESESWAQDEPLSKEDGLKLLNKLKEKISDKEREKREKLFEQAERFVENAQGVQATKIKSFADAEDKRIRVDLEIRSGWAFVCLLILVVAAYFLLF
ncbi:MAG: hypothetical protein AAF849_23110 [Bacteroidota bacterium]